MWTYWFPSILSFVPEVTDDTFHWAQFHFSDLRTNKNSSSAEPLCSQRSRPPAQSCLRHQATHTFWAGFIRSTVMRMVDLQFQKDVNFVRLRVGSLSSFIRAHMSWYSNHWQIKVSAWDPVIRPWLIGFLVCRGNQSKSESFKAETPDQIRTWS